MKKRLFLFAIITLLWSVSNAYCSENCEKMPCDCTSKSEIKCEEKSKKDKYSYSQNNKKDCETLNQTNCECEIDNDDEYCTYNQCFFDKHYRKMKKALCLTNRQEKCIDKIYRDFKTDIESCCCNYRNEKNKLLEMIECDKNCQKEQKRIIKEIKKEAKEKYNEFKNDIKEHLCKNQKNDFQKFIRNEKRKMKKIIKYSVIYKLPCVNCCNK